MALEEDNELDKVTVRDAIKVAVSRYTDREAVELLKKEKNKAKRNDKMASIFRDAVLDSPIYMIMGLPHVYVYSEGRYCPFSWSVFGDALYDAMRETGVPDGEFGRIDSIIRLLIRAVSSNERALDATVAVMANGVYDTLKHGFHGFSKKYISVSRMEYKYVPDATCPLWESFLKEVLPVVEHRMLLQECFAAAFVDRTKAKLEHITILKGNGANGKSVIFTTMLKLFGEQNVSTFSVSDLINGKREQNIASCNGKRMNYCSEIRTVEINAGNADAFKALVSGEPTMARALYREPFIARNIPLLFANANMLPRISDPSLSVRRRLVIIPFDVRIPEEQQDKELAVKLERELPGIFNWVMEGLKRLQERGYRICVPSDIRDSVEEYLFENNTVLKWLKETRYFGMANPATREKPIEIGAASLHSLYLSWCKDNYEEPMSRVQVARDLAEFGFEKVRKKSGMVYTVYIGTADEEARVLAVQEALDKQRDSIDAKFISMSAQGVSVIGLAEAENYLGLAPDSLQYYYQSNMLDGTFTVSKRRPKFYIRRLQKRLASLGYYSRIRNSGKFKSEDELNNTRKQVAEFNEQMRIFGQPFYKTVTEKSWMPAQYKKLIRVPLDWKFTNEAARELIRLHSEINGEEAGYNNEPDYNEYYEREETEENAPDAGVEQ